MPKINIIYQYLGGGVAAAFARNCAEIGMNLSHLSQCDAVQCTVSIKVSTSMLSITAGFQLLNLFNIILIHQDSVFLGNSAKFQNLLQTLVFGVIHCPCLLTFQT